VNRVNHLKNCRIFVSEVDVQITLEKSIENIMQAGSGIERINNNFIRTNVYEENISLK